jgi:hypothetical protein
MIFIGLLFLSALAVSGCAAWFSVAGLISIFSSAPLATGLMGGSLELAKLVAASWIYRNWHTAPRILRYYFTASVVVLSIITSLGIFGYLSKAHLDQAAVTGQSVGQLTVIDEKIRTHRENIDASRKALKQMDEAVDQVMARSSDEKGADKAVAIRRSQQKERSRLLSEIEAEQKEVAQLNERRAPLSAEVRKIEAEIGPIKYVAELIYGASTEDMIGKAVRLIIMSLIFVFDPLAILLVIAGNMSLLARENILKQTTLVAQATTAPETTPAVFQYEEVQDTVDPEEVKIHKKDVHTIPPEILDRVFNKSGPRPEHPHAQRANEVPKN